MNAFMRRAALNLFLLLVAVTSAHGQGTSAQTDREPNSSMDGELFYQLLLGEVNALGGEPGLGYQLLLDAARKTLDPRLFKRAADIALQARSGESALQAARAWRQAIPASRDANRYLLQILIGLNRLPDALEPLKREIAATEPGERAVAIANIPRLFARAGDKKVAANVVEQTLAEYTGATGLGATSWTSIGRMRLEASDPSGALEAAQRGHAADAAAEGPAILALNLIDPKTPQAEAIVRKYLEGPGRLELRMDYARFLLNAKRYAEAAAQLKLITTQKPSYAQAWLIRGVLDMQDKQEAAAEHSLRRYVELATAQNVSANKDADAASPEETARGLTQAYLTLAEIAEKRKDFTGAKAWLDRIDSPQEMIGVQSRRAALLARDGKLLEARALLRALPARNAAEIRLKTSAEVQLLRENKQYQAAYDVLREALAADPTDLDFLYDQAMMADKLGRLDEMERLLRHAIATKPDYHHAYNALGYSFAERNIRLPEARQLILKALEFAPGDPYISDSLAWVEFRSGNMQEALRILRQAFQDKPDAEIAAHLGEVLWTIGERTQAMKVWKEGMALNPDNETLVETLKRLRVRL